MNPICIITDSAAQFPNPVFPGREFVHFFNLPHTDIGKADRNDPEVNGTTNHFSESGIKSSNKTNTTQDTFDQILQELNSKYDEIIILTASSFLNPYYSVIEKTALHFNGSARLYLIDTQTISTGQGLLVEQAARAIHSGVSASNLERELRKSIPLIFNILCTPSLNYLYQTGIVDQPQSVVSEYFNLYPIFVLEDGKFTPISKVRNYHTAIESFQEFLEEFDNLAHISFLHGGMVPPVEIRCMKQFCDDSFPDTPFSEHQLNPFLTTMFGSEFMGMFLSE